MTIEAYYFDHAYIRFILMKNEAATSLSWADEAAGENAGMAVKVPLVFI